MPAIVDFEAFEGSKENIQPLRRGRCPVALVESLKAQAAPAKRREADTMAQRAALETGITSYEGDDPLTPWLKYIAWTQQAFASGAEARAHVVPLLAKCTDTFKADGRYKQNL
jgi:checkpoint serine/threonine-protein kinase